MHGRSFLFVSEVSIERKDGGEKRKEVGDHTPNLGEGAARTVKKDGGKFSPI